MTAAKLQVGQNQHLVQIESSSAEPIEIPMPMGARYWQGQKNNAIKIKGATLPDFLGSGPYDLHIESEVFNFKPRRLLGNKTWEGTVTRRDA